MDVRLDSAAIDRFVRDDLGAQVVDEAAEIVRDRARRSASAIDGARTSAIITDHGRDAEGAWADVGYNPDHYGFVLWWHEVGTVDYAPTPHLRPALGRRTH